MALLSVCQDVALTVGVEVPTVVAAGTTRTARELLSLANGMAQRIAYDSRDWSALKTLATFTGDGVLTQFALPTDYKRMLKDTRLLSSTAPHYPLTHYPSSDDWLALQAQGYTPPFGGWTIIGSNVQVSPALANAATIKFYYLSKYPVTASTGQVTKTEFSADTDLFRLDERLLKLGMIWQWKANKGAPYAEDMATFEDALANVAGADRGSLALRDRKRFSRAVTNIAYPYPLG